MRELLNKLIAFLIRLLWPFPSKPKTKFILNYEVAIDQLIHGQLTERQLFTGLFLLTAQNQRQLFYNREEEVARLRQNSSQPDLVEAAHFELEKSVAAVDRKQVIWIPDSKTSYEEVALLANLLLYENGFQPVTLHVGQYSAEILARAITQANPKIEVV